MENDNIDAICVVTWPYMHRNLVSVTVPGHVDILAERANGAQENLRFSAVTGLSPAPNWGRRVRCRFRWELGCVSCWSAYKKADQTPKCDKALPVGGIVT